MKRQHLNLLAAAIGELRPFTEPQAFETFYPKVCEICALANPAFDELVFRELVYGNQFVGTKITFAKD